MEIVIKGSGEIAVRFVDRTGKTLIEEAIRVSGSETVEARREVTLFAETAAGPVSVSPVLVRQAEKQRVTFDGEQPASFTKKRCQDMGCSQRVMDDAERGCVQGLAADIVQVPAQGPRGSDSGGRPEHL